MLRRQRTVTYGAPGPANGAGRDPGGRTTTTTTTTNDDREVIARGPVREPTSTPDTTRRERRPPPAQPPQPPRPRPTSNPTSGGGTTTGTIRRFRRWWRPGRCPGRCWPRDWAGCLATDDPTRAIAKALVAKGSGRASVGGKRGLDRRPTPHHSGTARVPAVRHARDGSQKVDDNQRERVTRPGHSWPGDWGPRAVSLRSVRRVRLARAGVGGRPSRPGATGSSGRWRGWRRV